jgi:hypothetical protein
MVVVHKLLMPGDPGLALQGQLTCATPSLQATWYIPIYIYDPTPWVHLQVAVKA